MKNLNNEMKYVIYRNEVCNYQMQHGVVEMKYAMIWVPRFCANQDSECVDFYANQGLWWLNKTSNTEMKYTLIEIKYAITKIKLEIIETKYAMIWVLRILCKSEVKMSKFLCESRHIMTKIKHAVTETEIFDFFNQMKIWFWNNICGS